jgi:hypothetical protein
LNAIPELGVDATDTDVAVSLNGSADVKLLQNIRTVSEYSDYRTWASGLVGVSQRQIKESPNSWLSYALKTKKLITAAPKSGDVTVDAFEKSATDGVFEFNVNVKNIAVGDGAL